ncbi:hypothetical protein [Streptomyces sp. S.PNR 29]|uniref:hypothetical protein n=1 Tax=Streptomyces sp. S.PNR 29 TaxID=2973805 RepID=UPI0025AFF15F|nr:hypothetical protein [Streptomyces sp. S.PNR 29]MDN0197863.1 hypothetical protein [Streptomyces sp. S.PNR 29]
MTTDSSSPVSNELATDPIELSALQKEAASPAGDPVRDLVRAAVADRPLEEVVDLITMLEQSPEYADATIDALRAVGVNRSVEDLTRMVALLTRPPRHAGSADEAIRAAAEGRSVEDVTRLMELLRRTPLVPHCGQEAVRAAATGRPVEDLVELIGRLAAERRGRADRPEAVPPQALVETEAPKPAGRPAGPVGIPSRGTRPVRGIRWPSTWSPGTGSVARQADGTPAWPGWLAVGMLAVCGVLYFPLRPQGTPLQAYGIALGLSALCLVLALLLTVRHTVPVLAAAVLAPAALAVAKVYESPTSSLGLSRAMNITLAPSYVAAPAAVLASLIGLAALLGRMSSQVSDGRWAAQPMVRARRTAD